MRFALLGDHVDGLGMARALAESGRHEIAVYSGPAAGLERLGRWGLKPARMGDLEEILADPSVEGVIVAGSAASRAAQLRRALQSERHVLCVHPLDQNADTAYEAAMLQADAHTVLLPLLPETLHPGIRRLADLIAAADGPGMPEAGPEDTAIQTHAGGSRLTSGRIRGEDPPAMLEIERWETERVLVDGGLDGRPASLPGWDVLRFLGGEVAEVIALAEGDELAPDEPVVLAGRFEAGGMFHGILLPHQPEARCRIALKTGRRAELMFPQGWPGPARLCWHDFEGCEHVEAWEAWNPWTPLVHVFEAALHGRPSALTWQDEVRALELDGAAQRSVARRRSSTLEYQEATEEAGFKGTMTLLGCSLIWFSLILLILSVWFPRLGWLIPPVLAIFLIMQVFRWVLPRKQDEQPSR